MKLSEQELNKLRDVSIHSILGIENTGRKVAISCPHSNSDKTPSCYIYPDNSYKCFSCGAFGFNALDFTISVEGDFLSAVNELIKYI